jgi:predicted ArsR family transcriptional regulator
MLIIIIFFDVTPSIMLYSATIMSVYDVVGTNENSTRWNVVKALRAAGRATVSELAEAVSVKGVTVRHHLTALQAEGLVDAEQERRDVGRPVYVYALTPQAERLFPQNYHVLVDGLLDAIRDEFDQETVERVIHVLAESMADDLRQEVAGLPPEARRERLVQWLSERGLPARWRETSDGLELVKNHCPYYAIGHRHPELCAIDEALVCAVVEAQVERVACLLMGDADCALALIQPTTEASGTELEQLTGEGHD